MQTTRTVVWATTKKKSAAMMNPKGPLAWLEIDRTTKPVVDQFTVDQVLSQLFEQHPGLFQRLAECEVNRSSNAEVVRDFREQFRKILPKPDLAQQGSLIWEARRRVRFMSGLEY
jgi:hypothetical protein